MPPRLMGCYQREVCLLDRRSSSVKTNGNNTGYYARRRHRCLGNCDHFAGLFDVFVFLLKCYLDVYTALA